MADRYDWDRDRERNRESERDWDRERRSAGGSGYSEGRDWGRGRENFGRYGTENWRDNEGSADYRGRRSEERDDYNSRGDYGPQGTWGRYGDRPDFSRDYNWRSRGQDWEHRSDQGRNEDWGRHPDWGRDERNERYSGGTQTYGGTRDYGRGREWERGRNESDFGGANTGRTQLYGTGGGGFGTGFSSYGGGMGSFSGGMGNYSERGRFAGRGPKGWQRPDDRIREDINERLTDHPEIDASEIEVQVKNGEVTLTGTVEHRHAKRMAEDIAENISGVKDVHNNIRVQQQGSDKEHQQTGTMATSGTGTTTKSK